MEEKVMTILSDICGVEAEDLEPDLDLFELGLLDSFAVVQLLVKLEEVFAVSLDIEQLSREEIATPALIISLIGQKS